MATEFMAQIPFLKKIEIFLRRSVKKKGETFLLSCENSGNSFELNIASV